MVIPALHLLATDLLTVIQDWTVLCSAMSIQPCPASVAGDEPSEQSRFHDSLPWAGTGNLHQGASLLMGYDGGAVNKRHAGALLPFAM